jgi:hypothetical protein
MDVTQRGCPGDMAILANGSFYTSDGTQWLGLAGAAGAQYARTQTALAGALVQVARAMTAGADAEVAQRIARTQTAAADAQVVLQSARQTLATADAAVRAWGVTQGITAGAAVQQALAQTITAGALARATYLKTLPADAAVRATGTSTVTSSEYVVAGIADAIATPANGATVTPTDVDFSGTASTGQGTTAELWDDT